MCPRLVHKTTKINENSLICATVSPALNHVLLVYPSFPMIAITIIGFQININNESNAIDRLYHHMLFSVICVPKRTKNITIKKSLRDFIFELISNLYGDKESVIPAINAHISMENQARWNTLAKSKHRHIANNSRNSWDFAICLMIFGKIYTHIATVHATSQNPFTIIWNNIVDVSHHQLHSVININITIATTSWTIKNHIDIFPYNVLRSPLSERSFIITMVLLKVIAIAIYAEVMLSNPKIKHSQNQIIEVKITCQIPVNNDVFPTSFNVLGFILSPTIKSSSAIPICDNVVISPDGSMIHVILTISPVMIYHIINGCLRSLII